MRMQEKIGPALVTIEGAGNAWIVTLEDARIPAGIKTAKFATYEEALPMFDQTCEGASKIYREARPLPPPPDFVSALNI